MTVTFELGLTWHAAEANAKLVRRNRENTEWDAILEVVSNSSRRSCVGFSRENEREMNRHKKNLL
jgi:hypothetical protein